MAARTVHCTEALRWLKLRGWDLSPLTGQDRACLETIAHCWVMYFRSDVDGRGAALDAVASLLGGCQEAAWPMARELIAQAGDWSRRGQVWPHACRRFSILQERLSFRLARAV